MSRRSSLERNRRCAEWVNESLSMSKDTVPQTILSETQLSSDGVRKITREHGSWKRP
jgi:hypothetical protein